jgi:LysR family glycine cleavage system transcriptional activator
MNWRTLPPLSGLRAFAAFAQTGTVTDAGAALNVSHAAISQQLRALESHMGVALLDRSGRALALTPDGQALAFTLQGAFAEIAQTVAALTGAEDARPLQIACTPTFAANWLMPRLPRFRERHPDLDLMINPSPVLTDPAPGGIDVALRYGLGPWPGLDTRLLMPAPLLIVGAASLFPKGARPTVAELAAKPWLQEIGTNEATQWLDAQGAGGIRPRSVTHLPGNLVLDGLRTGQGLALVTRIGAEADLEAGRLCVFFEDDTRAGYHIVTRPGPARPPLRAFLRWLRGEAKMSQQDPVAKS